MITDDIIFEILERLEDSRPFALTSMRMYRVYEETDDRYFWQNHGRDRAIFAREKLGSVLRICDPTHLIVTYKYHLVNDGRHYPGNVCKIAAAGDEAPLFEWWFELLKNQNARFNALMHVVKYAAVNCLEYLLGVFDADTIACDLNCFGRNIDVRTMRKMVDLLPPDIDVHNSIERSGSDSLRNPALYYVLSSDGNAGAIDYVRRNIEKYGAKWRRVLAEIIGMDTPVVSPRWATKTKQLERYRFAEHACDIRAFAGIHRDRRKGRSVEHFAGILARFNMLSPSARREIRRVIRQIRYRDSLIKKYAR